MEKRKTELWAPAPTSAVKRTRPTLMTHPNNKNNNNNNNNNVSGAGFSTQSIAGNGYQTTIQQSVAFQPQQQQQLRYSGPSTPYNSNTFPFPSTSTISYPHCPQQQTVANQQQQQQWQKLQVPLRPNVGIQNAPATHSAVGSSSSWTLVCAGNSNVAAARPQAPLNNNNNSRDVTTPLTNVYPITKTGTRSSTHFQTSCSTVGGPSMSSGLSSGLGSTGRYGGPHVTASSTVVGPLYTEQGALMGCYGGPQVMASSSVGGPMSRASGSTGQRNIMSRVPAPQLLNISAAPCNAVAPVSSPGWSESSAAGAATPGLRPSFNIEMKQKDLSLRFLTCTIQGIKHWTEFKQKLNSPIMFEVFGVVSSAVSACDKSSVSVSFVLKDATDNINCAFYQIDRQLPRLTRGQWYRCVGHCSTLADYCHLKCLSVRAVTDTERRTYSSLVGASEAEMQQWVVQNNEL